MLCPDLERGAVNRNLVYNRSRERGAENRNIKWMNVHVCFLIQYMPRVAVSYIVSSSACDYQHMIPLNILLLMLILILMK